MQIIAFRHGIAVDADEARSAGISDADRELTPEGSEKTAAAAAGLRVLLKSVDLILQSPLLRARQTADLLAKVYPAATRAESKHLAPDGRADRLAGFLLQQLVGDRKLERVLIVGHEPGLSSWIGWGITGRADPLFPLKKAGACCIEFDGGPRAGKGVLQWLLTPAQLRKLA